MITEVVDTEHELQEHVHFHRVLTEDDPSVIFHSQFIQPEQSQIPYDHVENSILPVSARTVLLEQDSIEHLHLVSEKSLTLRKS